MRPIAFRVSLNLSSVDVMDFLNYLGRPVQVRAEERCWPLSTMGSSTLPDSPGDGTVSKLLNVSSGNETSALAENHAVVGARRAAPAKGLIPTSLSCLPPAELPAACRESPTP